MSSSGSENCHQGKAGKVPRMPSLGLGHTWLRLSSALMGLGNNSKDQDQGQVQSQHFLYTCEKEGNMATMMPCTCLFSGKGVWPWSSPASPSTLLMNEGEPTLDLGLEAQSGGTRVVRLSLETEDSLVSWL